MKFWWRRGPTQNPPCIVSARGMTSPAAADCRVKSVGQVVTWGCNGLRQAFWRWISRRCRRYGVGSPEYCGRSKFSWPIDLCELPRCSLSITSGRGSCGQLGSAKAGCHLYPYYDGLGRRPRVAFRRGAGRRGDGPHWAGTKDSGLDGGSGCALARYLAQDPPKFTPKFRF